MNWLTTLRLTLTQWALLTFAALVGLLVALLRLQGSRLHAAQVNALREHFGRQMDLQDDKVEKAKSRFDKAYDDYKDNR